MELPNDWAIDLNKEKDSTLLPKFIEWAESHKDYVANKVIDKHNCNYLGYFMGDLQYSTVLVGHIIITLEQWYEYYFPKWMPKQGEMILVKDSSISELYNKREFIIIHNSIYYCVHPSTGTLAGYKYAKPLSSQLQDKIDDLKEAAKELGLKINVTFE